MAEDKKELIRIAAIKTMARDGFYNTRAQKIAEEAGIAVGTIYNYFENKNDILDYIFAVEFKKRLAFLEQSSEKEGDFLAKMEYFLNLHFQEIKNNLDTGRILVKEKEFPRKEGSAAADYLNTIPDQLEKMIENAIKKGEIRKCQSELVSVIIFGAIQGVVEKAINNRPELLDTAADEIIKLLRSGI